MERVRRSFLIDRRLMIHRLRKGPRASPNQALLPALQFSQVLRLTGHAGTRWARSNQRLDNLFRSLLCLRHLIVESKV